MGGLKMYSTMQLSASCPPISPVSYSQKYYKKFTFYPRQIFLVSLVAYSVQI